MTKEENQQDAELAISSAGEFVFGWSPLELDDELLIRYYSSKVSEFIYHLDVSTVSGVHAIRMNMLCDIIGVKSPNISPQASTDAVLVEDRKNGSGMEVTMKEEDGSTLVFNRKKPDFFKLGACKGLDSTVMFPSNDEGEEFAKQICAGCSVGSDCLEFALDNREKDGVWGGASERDRRRIIRQRRK